MRKIKFRTSYTDEDGKWHKAGSIIEASQEVFDALVTQHRIAEAVQKPKKKAVGRPQKNKMVSAAANKDG